MTATICCSNSCASPRRSLPRFVLLENVPGLARDDLFTPVHRRSRGTRIRRHQRRARQRRFRHAATSSAPSASSRTSRASPKLTRGEAERRTVRDAIGGFASTAGCSGDPLHDHGEQRAKHVRSVIESIPTDGGSRADLGPDEQLDCHRQAEADGAGWGREPYGRMAWDGIASTITGGCVNPSKGRFSASGPGSCHHAPRSTAVAGISSRSIVCR